MKFDFNVFEFAGLIAPGSVVLLAVTLLHPQLLRAAEPEFLIATAILTAYIFGHLVGALGNALESPIELLGISRLASIKYQEWTTRGYLSDDQLPRLDDLVQTKLHRRPLAQCDSAQLKTVEKQMYLTACAGGHAQRLDTFNSLYNLSRGLAISFAIALIVTLAAGRFDAAMFCAVAAGLTVYRMRKFRDVYSRELVQQFLFLGDRRSEPKR
jgi:hypothetical protein